MSAVRSNRRVLAAAVSADPETYSEAFLGRPNAEYCRWILDRNHWGGAIELSILSRYVGGAVFHSLSSETARLLSAPPPMHSHPSEDTSVHVQNACSLLIVSA